MTRSTPPAEREFDLGDVLSVTTGVLLCPVTGSRRHPIDGVYDILNYMTGESLYTHQLPRVCKEAGPIILARHPQLAAVEIPEFKSPDDVPAFVARLREQHGAMFAIPQMNTDQHERIDPLSELAEKVDPSKIIIVSGDR
jgi:hypothetical protein